MKEQFEDRETLTQKIREWANGKGFRLILCTQEQVLKLEKTRVTVLQCSNRERGFYLGFRSNKTTSGKYMLFKSWNKHNHAL